VTEAELKAERLYCETLELAQLVGVPGDDQFKLLSDCSNACAGLRAGLIEHFDTTSRAKLN
jgi:hypothetical protein